MKPENLLVPPSSHGKAQRVETKAGRLMLAKEDLSRRLVAAKMEAETEAKSEDGSSDPKKNPALISEDLIP